MPYSYVYICTYISSGCLSFISECYRYIETINHFLDKNAERVNGKMFIESYVYNELTHYMFYVQRLKTLFCHSMNIIKEF